MGKRIRTKLLYFFRTLVDVQEVDLSGHPFFVIVHKDSVYRIKDRQQYKEIKRIKKIENFSEVNGNPSNIAPNVPRGRKILVCGAYHTMCVNDQLLALKKAGYDAEIYDKATVKWSHP